MFPGTDTLRVRCIFQLGTPPQPYAVVQETGTNRTAVVRITPELFDFLEGAGIEICQPVSVPPGSLIGRDVLCVFRMFIGAQEPIPYAVTEDGDISIIQITDAAFAFFSFLGVPTCPIINAPGVET